MLSAMTIARRFTSVKLRSDELNMDMPLFEPVTIVMWQMGARAPA